MGSEPLQLLAMTFDQAPSGPSAPGLTSDPKRRTKSSTPFRFLATTCGAGVSSTLGAGAPSACGATAARSTEAQRMVFRPHGPAISELDSGHLPRKPATRKRPG